MHSPHVEPGRKWAARWIWDEAAAPEEQNVYYYFRRTFELPECSDSFRLFIAADTRYQLFVNGLFIGRGAPQSQPFLQYYDEHEVAEYLIDGVNCLAVIVNHLGTLAETRGGLLLEMEDAGGYTIVATDGSWKVRRAKAWQQDAYCVRANKMTPFQEFFDARQVPEGWTEADFDDDAWADATVIRGRISDRPPAAGPWSRLVPRDIPFMHSEEVLAARIESVEESLDLTNRTRSIDLAPTLSQVGGPIRHTVFEGEGNLCREDGDTVVRSSVAHRDLDFDGLYVPAVVLDFGKVITGRARLHLTGVEGGMVDIGYAERLIDGHFNIAMECEFADRYVMRNGEQVFESFCWKAFRYLKLRFRSCFEPVTVHSVKGITSTYPYEELGGFSSSDETLNGVFRISRETLRLCSNECLMDTPWREQAQWLGDVALVTVPAIYACFGDPRLPGKFFRQAAGNQHPTGMISNVSNTVNYGWLGTIPDYSLWWVRGLWGHYLYTGEAEWIHRHYPEALRVLHAHLPYVNDWGLIEDMPYWVFIDWADTDRRGECTAYNAIFYGALEALDQMADLKKDEYTQGLVRNLMSGIRENLQARLFDERRGRFADANIDDELSEKAGEHASMSAIRFGLCDADKAKRIVHSLYECGERTSAQTQPFFTTIVLQALDRIGRTDLALRVIRDRWGKRMLERGATSVFEEWYQNGSRRSGEFAGFLRTHSHAWSACPAEFLIVNLMGLEILEPGCRRVRLRPRQTDCDYRATFPAPQGPITVHYVDGDVKVSLPDGISAE